MSKTSWILHPKLTDTISSLSPVKIPPVRKEDLAPLISYIQEKVESGEEVKLNFICTHNSRRSQFSQVWAQIAADFHGIEATCFSGGVEVTAFNERAVQTLKYSGFSIKKLGETNPKYLVTYSEDAPPVIAFSKLYDDSVNPDSGFAAIMTCSHADENCPFIAGAETRIPVRYNDPKEFDDTLKESEKYEEVSLQIANEMFYVFSQIKYS